MCLATKRRRSMPEYIVILAILIVSLQQVVVASLEVHQSGSKDMDSEHMENGVDLNAYYGTYYRLKYPGIFQNTYAPPDSVASIDRRSSSNTYAYRKGCIRRNGSCDKRPSDCCFSSSCRCNLWGSSCRCQRMGLFQKWG